jgi:hypothetical protein
VTLFLTTHHIAEDTPAGLIGRTGAGTLEDAFVELTGGELRREEASSRERLASARRGGSRL